MFKNNVSELKLHLPKRFNLKETWKCSLMELLFLPEKEISTRHRVFFGSNIMNITVGDNKRRCHGRQVS